MIAILHVELDLFAITILLIMVISRHRDSLQSLEQRLFNYALIANALTLLFDGLVRLLDGTQIPGGYLWFHMSVDLYYFFNPLVTFACLIYCDYKIFGSVRDLKRRMRYYTIPLAVIYIVYIVNFLTGWFYSVDGANNYVRGPVFIVLPFLLAVYPVWMEFFAQKYAYRQRKEAERTELRKLGWYAIPPLFCLVFQILVPGLQLVWISSVVSFVMIYINIQNRQIYTDELTGLNNRRQIARAFIRRTESLGQNKLYAVMIDADDFKKINDTYGHARGDALLVQAARILEDICEPRKDFLVRMGGDEFLILATRGAREKFQIDEDIEAAMNCFNRGSACEPRISLSCGAAQYGTDGINTLDLLLTAADGEMYRNKLLRKNRMALSKKAAM